VNVWAGVSENNGDGKVQSTGTTQTLLETDYKAAAAAKKVCDVEGKDVVNECTAQQ
jgi:hypothetical protein